MKTVRYFAAKPGRSGQVRYFWQPSRHLRSAGFHPVRLSDDRPMALMEAERRNAELDAWRMSRDTPVTSGTPRRPASKAGVYVIGDPNGDAIKIGVSVTPWRRLTDLQVGNDKRVEVLLFFRPPLGVDAYAVEARVHQRLIARRREGEWFAASVDLALKTIYRVASDLRAAGERPGNKTATELDSEKKLSNSDPLRSLDDFSATH